MRIFKNKFFAVFFAIFLLLMDGHLSQTLTQLSGGTYTFSSQLFLIVLLFYSFYLGFSSLYIVSLALLLGLIYDTYYLNVIGIQIFSLLVCLYLLTFFNRRLAFSFFKEFLFFLFLSLLLGGMNYGLALLFDLTAYPISAFVLLNLLPSLFLNALLFILFYFILGKYYIKQFHKKV